STSVQVTDDDEANITGNLTLNGVTKPVTIEAELAGAGTNGMNQKKTVGFHGETTIKRSEFNIPWGIPFGIGDEVELEITVAFEKQYQSRRAARLVEPRRRWTICPFSLRCTP